MKGPSLLRSVAMFTTTRHVSAFLFSPSTTRRSLQSRLYYSRDKYELVENLFSALANRSRSWKRLRHVLDLAMQDRPGCERVCHSVADIGTDHGLLALGLSTTGRFDQVTGVDRSLKALENGAFRLERELQDYFQQKQPSIGLSHTLADFRCGNGLEALKSGEADIVCIAGMGIHTMLDILQARADNTDKRLLLNVFDTRKIVVQPQKPSPRNLSTLYRSMFDMGYGLFEERMEWSRGRFYVSASFHRFAETQANDIACGNAEPAVPCSFLLEQVSESNQSPNTSFVDFVRFHRHWLKVKEENRPIEESEKRWLETVASIS